MNEKSCQSDGLHGTDEELLLLLDDELPEPDLARVRGHLVDCDGCRERLTRIETTLTVAAMPRVRAMDAAGPTALLRARLAELANDEKTGARAGFRAGFGTGVGAGFRGLARGFAFALALLVVTGIVVLRQETARRPSLSSRLLPDPNFTPGATRVVALQEICAVDREDVVREVPAPLQKKVFEEYGMSNAPAAEFEVDYLITPGLGGADDVRNLWPEPHANTLWNSYVKDQLEDRLHKMVCDREIPLAEAQREIAGNWIAAYKKYFHTERPVGNATGARGSVEPKLAGAVQLVASLRRKQRWS